MGTLVATTVPSLAGNSILWLFIFFFIWNHNSIVTKKEEERNLKLESPYRGDQAMPLYNEYVHNAMFLSYFALYALPLFDK